MQLWLQPKKKDIVANVHQPVLGLAQVGSIYIYYLAQTWTRSFTADASTVSCTSRVKVCSRQHVMYTWRWAVLSPPPELNQAWLTSVLGWWWWWWWSLARIWGECSAIHSLLALFFKVEISSRTLIPLFSPGSVHSGWVSWDDCGQMFQV